MNRLLYQVLLLLPPSLNFVSHLGVRANSYCFLRGKSTGVGHKKISKNFPSDLWGEEIFQSSMWFVSLSFTKEGLVSISSTVYACNFTKNCLSVSQLPFYIREDVLLN